MASNDLGAAYATAAVKVADIAPKIQTLPTKIEARKGKNMVSFLQKRILLAAEKDHAHQVVRHCETSFTVFFLPKSGPGSFIFVSFRPFAFKH